MNNPGEDEEKIKALLEAYKTICDPELVYGTERELSPMPNKLFSPEEREALEKLSHDPELMYRFLQKDASSCYPDKHDGC